MNENSPVTFRDLDLIAENISLKVGQQIEDKFAAFEERLHASNIERRDSIVRELTGFDWDQRERIEMAIQYSDSLVRDRANTKKLVKKAAIGFGVPLVLGSAITWFLTQYDNLIP